MKSPQQSSLGGGKGGKGLRPGEEACQRLCSSWGPELGLEPRTCKCKVCFPWQPWPCPAFQGGLSSSSSSSSLWSVIEMQRSGKAGVPPSLGLTARATPVCTCLLSAAHTWSSTFTVGTGETFSQRRSTFSVYRVPEGRSL